VCHTDLHYREGGINDDFPFLLGHEAAGIVESVGRRDQRRARRLRHPQLACGVRDCRACNKGKPWYCFATHNATQKMTLHDGTELSPGPRHRRVREKTLSPPASAPRSTRTPPARRPGCSGAASWPASAPP
jgi:S-(hydroxymethyl)mycothiol dehydrogenase